MEWFKNTKTKDEAKKLYYKLAKIYHPDAGNEPDGEIFVEIDEQYKAHLKYLENPRHRRKPKPKEEKQAPPKQKTVEVVETIEPEPAGPRFTPKQKKHLVKGASLLFNVFAAKIVDRI